MAGTGESFFFQRAKLRARKVVFSGKTLFVLEGDLLLDEMQLAAYAQRKDRGDEDVPIAEMNVGSTTAKLLGISREGKMLRWKPGYVLSYYVAKETFPEDSKYRAVRENVRTATENWMAICGIEFQYRGELDTDQGKRSGSAVFSVVHQDVNGVFIAAAFFPDDPPERRVVVIDPSYFASNLRFDRVGVLRHELGHVLGFRHEHIRSGAPAGCPGEPLFDTIDLTKYDPKSVMHYFCGDVGSTELAITQVDVDGAQRLYGLPLSAYSFVS